MERRRSSDGVILWGVPYGVLDRNKRSNGVNDLFQEGKPYIEQEEFRRTILEEGKTQIESKGFKVISVAPEIGDNSNNVADYNIGKAVDAPKWLTKFTGTSLPISLPFDKREARKLISEVEPDFLFLEEPTASFCFFAHGLISGMPRREDGRPISAIVSRHHAGVYAERTEKIYRFLLEFGRLVRRPEFTRFGVPNGKVTPSVRNTIFDNIDRRIAVSYKTSEAFKERLHDGAEYEIIYNGINTEELTPEGPVIEEWREDGKDVVLCMPGRLERRKGVPYFIQAAPIIKREKPNTLFMLAGGNESDRKPYEDMVDAMGIRDYFRFAERLPRKIYPDGLRTPRLCVCPAEGGEGFGRIVVEPLACGTPVVASNTDGYNEAADMGRRPFALLAEPRNPRDIAEKVLEILNWSPETRERMKWEAALYVRQRFAWPIIAEQIAKVLNEAYNSHGGVDWSKFPSSATVYRKK